MQAEHAIAPVDVERTMAAEMSVLGAILLNNRMIYDTYALAPQDFGLSAHRSIFARMRDLSERGCEIDCITLGDELSKHGELQKVGEYAYLSSLTDGVPERPSISHYVEIVKDGAKRRTLQADCLNIAERLTDPTIGTDSCIETLEHGLMRLQANGAQPAHSVRDIVPEVLNEMEAIRRMPTEAIGLTTGLLSLDRVTTGIRTDEYWIVGALPSRGKTVLGVQVAAANAKAGIPVLFFSHEMTRRQLVRRMLPGESGVAASKVRDPRYASEAEIRTLQESAAEIAQWPLWVADPDQLSARELVAIARQHIKTCGIKLIVVDYLQLIDAPGKELRERVAAASNALRTIPKLEGVPVVGLSQLARPRDRNENGRPAMTDLKESGAIEAHAHVVLLLYRPKNDEGEWTGEDEVIIAKQREGLVGWERVRLDGNKLQFTERPR